MRKWKFRRNRRITVYNLKLLLEVLLAILRLWKNFNPIRIFLRILDKGNPKIKRFRATKLQQPPPTFATLTPIIVAPILPCA